MKNRKNAEEMIPFLAAVVAFIIIIYMIQAVLDFLF